MKPRRNNPTVETIAGECLAVRIRLLSRAVSRIYDDALRPLGIKVSQLNVLMVVAKGSPISAGEVARRLSMEKSTLSRNVERMRAHGWIDVSESGRKQMLAVGPAGNKLIEQVLPAWRNAQQEAEALLGARGAQSVHRAANAVWAQRGRA